MSYVLQQGIQKMRTEGVLETGLAGVRVLKRNIHRRLLSPRVIDDLGRSSNPYDRLVAAALRDVLIDAPSKGEQIWIEAIENRRHELKQSTDAVTFTDYGVGPTQETYASDDVSRPVSEMAMGRRENVLLLFALIRRANPETVIELGTSAGISAAYQSVALTLNDNGGELVTIEGAQPIGSTAQETFDHIGLECVSLVCGTFRKELPDVLDGTGEIDMIFIDGHHDEQATWDYFEMVAPHLSEDALVVFDDINWSAGMARVWDRLRSDNRLIPIVDTGQFGVCIAGDGAERTEATKVVL